MRNRPPNPRVQAIAAAAGLAAAKRLSSSGSLDRKRTVGGQPVKRSVLLFAAIMCLAGRAALGAAGDGAFGQFDPSDVNKPNTPTIWRAYSAVDPSMYSENLIVSTNIAISSDNGQTFSPLLVVNPGSDLVAPPDYTWVNEVATLVYDPADPDPNRIWKVIWDHHIVEHGQIEDTVMWLGVKAANVPNGVWSDETKLIAGSDYNPNNLFSPGTTQYALPASIRDCHAITEPGALTASDGFYLSVACVYSDTVGVTFCLPLIGNGSVCPNPNVRTATHSRIPLMKFTHSKNGNMVMSVIGNFPNSTADVPKFVSAYGAQYPELKSTIGFGAPDLVKAADGTTYLLVSPHNDNNYMGCAVFQVANLNTASIQRTSNGAPYLVKYIPGIPDTHRGACTYATNETASGVNLSQVEPDSFPTKPDLQIVETGIPLP
jgi:hypothetical protein